MPSILVATWDDGLFALTGKVVQQELAGQSVRSLVADVRGRVLAIVGGHSLCRRSSDGEWREVAKSDFDLSCCVPVGEIVFVGTDDARILRVDPEGAQHRLPGFDAVEDRDKWYAGAMVVDGQADGAAARSSFDGGDLRWCRASGQRSRWRSSAIDRRRLDVAAHDRYRERRASGLCAPNPARARDRGGRKGALHQPGCRRNLDYRKAKDFTLLIALPLLLGETTFSCRHRSIRSRRRARSTGARSTATVRCSRWMGACRGGPTAKPIPTASRPEIQRSP